MLDTFKLSWLSTICLGGFHYRHHFWTRSLDLLNLKNQILKCAHVRWAGNKCYSIIDIFHKWSYCLHLIKWFLTFNAQFTTSDYIVNNFFLFVLTCVNVINYGNFINHFTKIDFKEFFICFQFWMDSNDKIFIFRCKYI